MSATTAIHSGQAGPASARKTLQPSDTRCDLDVRTVDRLSVPRKEAQQFVGHQRTSAVSGRRRCLRRHRDADVRGQGGRVVDAVATMATVPWVP